MIKDEAYYVKAVLEGEEETQSLYELACFYDESGNTNGARYLAMQLQKRMVPESMDAFIDRYCDFLIEKKKMIHQKLLMLCIVFSLLLSAVFLLLSIHIGLILFQAVSVVILLYYALKTRMVQNFLIKQEEALKPYVNEEVLKKLDRS